VPGQERPVEVHAADAFHPISAPVVRA
jgi:hypothetical protein